MCIGGINIPTNTEVWIYQFAKEAESSLQIRALDIQEVGSGAWEE
jgi:hypothetical protein